MDSEEVDKRLEAAKASARRQEETAEFLQSLKSDTELVRPVFSPEAWALRNKARAAASRGDVPVTNCRHPFQYLEQYEDTDPSVKRKGLPVNLFECGVCHGLLWLVDAFGNEKSDG